MPPCTLMASPSCTNNITSASKSPASRKPLSSSPTVSAANYGRRGPKSMAASPFSSSVCSLSICGRSRVPCRRTIRRFLYSAYYAVFRLLVDLSRLAYWRTCGSRMSRNMLLRSLSSRLWVARLWAPSLVPLSRRDSHCHGKSKTALPSPRR